MDRPDRVIALSEAARPSPGDPARAESILARSGVAVFLFITYAFAQTRTIEVPAGAPDGRALAELVGASVKSSEVKRALSAWKLEKQTFAPGASAYLLADGCLQILVENDVVEEVAMWEQAGSCRFPEPLAGGLRYTDTTAVLRGALGAEDSSRSGTLSWKLADDVELSVTTTATGSVKRVRVVASMSNPEDTPDFARNGVNAERLEAARKAAASAAPVVPTAVTPAPAPAVVAVSSTVSPTVAAPSPARATPAPPPAPAAPALAAFPSLDTPARTGKTSGADAAVVIGLEDYAFIADVPYARRDAQAFYDLLVYTRGVPGSKVQLLTQGGREHILAAVQKAASEVGSGGTLWVYFAGHGAANPSTGARMVLGDDVRSDAVAFAARGVEVAEIERAVVGARSILVLDACFSGAGRSGASILGGSRLAVPAYALATPASDSAQWNATSPDQVAAPLDATSHGAFTYFAVGALRGWADGELDGARDGVVTAAEAQAYVIRELRLAQKNQQMPVWIGPEELALTSGVSERR